MWSSQSVCYKWPESKDFKALAHTCFTQRTRLETYTAWPHITMGSYAELRCMNPIFPFILTL
jgi:hypothetical protein